MARGLARLVVPVQGRLRAAADPAPRAQPRGEEAQNVMHVSVFTELTTRLNRRSAPSAHASSCVASQRPPSFGRPFADSTLAVSKEGAEDYKILPLSSHFQELEGE